MNYTEYKSFLKGNLTNQTSDDIENIGLIKRLFNDFEASELDEIEYSEISDVVSSISQQQITLADGLIKAKAIIEFINEKRKRLNIGTERLDSIPSLKKYKGCTREIFQTLSNLKSQDEKLQYINTMDDYIVQLNELEQLEKELASAEISEDLVAEIFQNFTNYIQTDMKLDEIEKAIELAKEQLKIVYLTNEQMELASHVQTYILEHENFLSLFPNLRLDIHDALYSKDTIKLKVYADLLDDYNFSENEPLYRKLFDLKDDLDSDMLFLDDSWVTTDELCKLMEKLFDTLDEIFNSVTLHPKLHEIFNLSSQIKSVFEKRYKCVWAKWKPDQLSENGDTMFEHLVSLKISKKEREYKNLLIENG